MRITKIAKKDTIPYKIILLTPGGPRQIGKVDAHSEMQARRFFLERDKEDYASYIERDYTIKAIFDEEEFERRKRVKQYEKERKEEQIQNAWWNK